MKYYIYQNDTKIAEVEDEKTYTVTGLEPDTTYHFAVSAFNGLKESEKSNVLDVTTSNIPLTAITLAIESQDDLETGGTYQVTVTLDPENATVKQYTYESSQPAVATIDETGLLTALTAGTTTVTVTVDDKTATLELTIYEALVVPTNLKATNVTTTGFTLTWS